jgi:hypothetical protein
LADFCAESSRISTGGYVTAAPPDPRNAGQADQLTQFTALGLSSAVATYWQAQRYEPLCPAKLHLEEKFGTELQHTGILGAGHLPEVAIVAAAIHRVELSVVEGVEGLCTELQMESLMDGEVFEQCNVPVKEPRSRDDVLTGIAEPCPARLLRSRVLRAPRMSSD